MIFLSGLAPRVLLATRRDDVGLMLNPRYGFRLKHLNGMTWAFENDCYARSPDLWLARLPKLVLWQKTCLFTPIPDVVGDHRATWERWHEYAPMVHHLGFRLAYVSQDGESRWPSGAACLFVGGTTAWKLSEASYALARRAKEAGLWLHMGRVNSLRRLRAALLSGFDSVDGTYLRRGAWSRLCGFLNEINGPQTFMEVA